MYGYIKGIVTEINTNNIILECNNIGYLINVANPYTYKEGESYTVYLYNHIRDDEYALYGFKKIEDKEMFLKLINVKGLGPKTALPMFGLGSTAGIIDAIERENILYLKKFPKVGDKLARQIILDLKGKLAVDNQEVSYDEELADVLSGLGYKINDIKKVLPKITSDLSLEEKVKEALKLMLK